MRHSRGSEREKERTRIRACSCKEAKQNPRLRDKRSLARNVPPSSRTLSLPGHETINKLRDLPIFAFFSLSPPPRRPLAPASLTHLGQYRPNDRAVKTFRQQHHDRCLLSSQRRQLRIKGGLARNGEHHTVAMAKNNKNEMVAHAAGCARARDHAGRNMMMYHRRASRVSAEAREGRFGPAYAH